LRNIIIVFAHSDIQSVQSINSLPKII